MLIKGCGKSEGDCCESFFKRQEKGCEDRKTEQIKQPLIKLLRDLGKGWDGKKRQIKKIDEWLLILTNADQQLQQAQQVQKAMRDKQLEQSKYFEQLKQFKDLEQKCRSWQQSQLTEFCQPKTLAQSTEPADKKVAEDEAKIYPISLIPIKDIPEEKRITIKGQTYHRDHFILALLGTECFSITKIQGLMDPCALLLGLKQMEMTYVIIKHPVLAEPLDKETKTKLFDHYNITKEEFYRIFQQGDRWARQIQKSVGDVMEGFECDESIKIKHANERNKQMSDLRHALRVKALIMLIRSKDKQGKFSNYHHDLVKIATSDGKFSLDTVEMDLNCHDDGARLVERLHLKFSLPYCTKAQATPLLVGEGQSWGAFYSYDPDGTQKCDKIYLQTEKKPEK